MTGEKLEISFKDELARKAIHLAMLVVPILIMQFGKGPVLWVMAPLAIVALLADLLRFRSVSFRRFIDKLFGKMLRSEESDGSFSVNGATWVLCSFSLVIFLFPPAIAAASLAIFLLGDAFAAIIGRSFGKHKILSGKKSIEGSLAFIVFACLTIPFFPMLHSYSLIAAILIGMLVEIPDKLLNDNLRVPFAVAVVISIVERSF